MTIYDKDGNKRFSINSFMLFLIVLALSTIVKIHYKKSDSDGSSGLLSEIHYEIDSLHSMNNRFYTLINKFSELI